VEEELEEEAPAKGKGAKGRKGKGKGRAKKTNSKARSAAENETETETEEEVQIEIINFAVPSVPRVVRNSDDDSLPDVEEIVLETQPLFAAEPLFAPETPQSKKRAREESTTPTPRAAKKQAVSSASGGPAAAGPSGTQLPTPRVFFKPTQPSSAASPARKATAPTAAAPAAGPSSAAPAEPAKDNSREEDDEVAQMVDEDEVPEEELDQEEVDQLRSSVPLLSPKKKKPVPAPPAPPVNAASPAPRSPQKKPKLEPTSPAPGRRPNRYATGGNESGRKQWTQVEDNALMASLQEIYEDGGRETRKWKMILDWHGPDGERTQLLKDRNNAQLKDRARNLFIKYKRNGQEPPVWLPDR